MLAGRKSKIGAVDKYGGSYMSELKKPFVKSKDSLWKNLYAQLGGEYRFPPKGFNFTDLIPEVESKPEVERKAVKWYKLEEPDPEREEYKMVPLVGQKTNVEVQCNNWKLKLSICFSSELEPPFTGPLGII